MILGTNLNYLLRRLAHPVQMKRVACERLTEPLHVNLVSAFVAVFGTFRARVTFDLVVRQQFAFPILYAADQAAKAGIKRLTLVEFGVANGAGLMNICSIAARVTKATGVEFNVFGFDTGKGMPPPIDYRDHPELYQEGDFPSDVSRLRAALPPFAQLVIGDIAETLPDFVNSLSADCPLGFVSVDVDYYSSSKKALDIFRSDPDKYMPVTLLYLDDIADDSSNPWAGEYLAVREFNEENRLRKIAPFNMLRAQRMLKNARWMDHINTMHVLDHEARTPKIRRERRMIGNEYVGIAFDRLVRNR